MTINYFMVSTGRPTCHQAAEAGTGAAPATEGSRPAAPVIRLDAKACPYCGRLMSKREGERGACDDCAPDERS
jgi:hypothetical protein